MEVSQSENTKGVVVGARVGGTSLGPRRYWAKMNIMQWQY